MEVGHRALAVHVGEAQREPVLVRGLPVCPQPRRALRGRHRVPHRLHRVATLRGVVRESVVVTAADRGQGHQGGVVERAAGAGGEPGLDGLAGDVVPEGEPVGTRPRDQQPVADALVDGLDRAAGDGRQEGEPAAGSEDRGCGEHVARSR